MIEKDLFYACMKFCEAYSNLLFDNEQIRLKGYYDDDYTVYRVKEFNKRYIEDCYNKLFSTIEDVENFKKGIVGRNKYKLTLEELKE